MVLKPFRMKIALAVGMCVLGIVMVADASCAMERHDQESIKAFLDHYFSSWSNGDMDAYKNCFHPKATIVFLDQANAPHAFPSIEVFIRTQEEAHQKSLVKMREIPMEKRITIAGKASQATVRWKLFKGLQTVTGTDLFTLVLTAGEWKILHLVVQND